MPDQELVDRVVMAFRQIRNEDHEVKKKPDLILTDLQRRSRFIELVTGYHCDEDLILQCFLSLQKAKKL